MWNPSRHCQRMYRPWTALESFRFEAETSIGKLFIYNLSGSSRCFELAVNSDDDAFSVTLPCKWKAAGLRPPVFASGRAVMSLVKETL